MRVLITGGSGQLGKCLQTVMQGLSISFFAPSHTELDITDRDSVIRVFGQIEPDIVIHAAAYNQVDLAETQPALCRAVNVIGTRNIAEMSAEYGAYLLFISTDYVFNGQKKGPYLPHDRKEPVSVYGHTKSNGEDTVLSASDRNAILRTSWLFGPSTHNFVQAILRASKNREEIDVVSDQIGSPTYADDLAQLIVKFLKIRPNGIFHGTNSGVCSRADYAREIISLSGIECRVHEIESALYPAPARRPLNSQLSNVCLSEIGVPLLPQWQNALRRYIESQ